MILHYLGNCWPTIDCIGGGLERRLIVVNFIRYFRKKNSKGWRNDINCKEADDELFQKIVDEKLFLTWLIDGMHAA